MFSSLEHPIIWRGNADHDSSTGICYRPVQYSNERFFQHTSNIKSSQVSSNQIPKFFSPSRSHHYSGKFLGNKMMTMMRHRMKDKEIEGSKEEKTQLMSETDSDEMFSVSQSAGTDDLDESTLTNEEEEALTTMMRKVTLKHSFMEKFSFFTRRRFCFTKLLAEFEGHHPVLNEVLNDATGAIDLCGLKSIFSNFGLSLECGTCQLRSEVGVLVMLVCSPKVVVVHKVERSGYHLHVTDVHFSRKKKPNHFLPVDESAFFWVD
jgi:hypothetical protein